MSINFKTFIDGTFWACIIFSIFISLKIEFSLFSALIIWLINFLICCKLQYSSEKTKKPSSKISEIMEAEEDPEFNEDEILRRLGEKPAASRNPKDYMDGEDLARIHYLSRIFLMDERKVIKAALRHLNIAIDRMLIGQYLAFHQCDENNECFFVGWFNGGMKVEVVPDGQKIIVPVPREKK